MRRQTTIGFTSVADYNVLPVVLREFCRAYLTWRRSDDLAALRVFVDAARIANLPRKTPLSA